MALISTPAAPDANTYATMAEADAYFASHLYGATWAAATPEDREKALVMATRQLDASFDWTGKASTPEQALAWPRIGMTSRNGYPIPPDAIPTDLKYAQMEYAQGMLGANLAEGADAGTQGIASIKAGPVELKFKDDIESKAVPDLVSNFIPDSWYTSEEEAAMQDSGSVPFFFKVM